MTHFYFTLWTQSLAFGPAIADTLWKRSHDVSPISAGRACTWRCRCLDWSSWRWGECKDVVFFAHLSFDLFFHHVHLSFIPSLPPDRSRSTNLHTAIGNMPAASRLSTHRNHKQGYPMIVPKAAASKDKSVLSLNGRRSPRYCHLDTDPIKLPRAPYRCWDIFSLSHVIVPTINYATTLFFFVSLFLFLSLSLSLSISLSLSLSLPPSLPPSLLPIIGQWESVLQTQMGPSLISMEGRAFCRVPCVRQRIKYNNTPSEDSISQQWRPSNPFLSPSAWIRSLALWVHLVHRAGSHKWMPGRQSVSLEPYVGMANWNAHAWAMNKKDLQKNSYNASHDRLLSHTEVLLTLTVSLARGAGAQDGFFFAIFLVFQVLGPPKTPNTLKTETRKHGETNS